MESRKNIHQSRPSPAPVGLTSFLFGHPVCLASGTKRRLLKESLDLAARSIKKRSRLAP